VIARYPPAAQSAIGPPRHCAYGPVVPKLLVAGALSRATLPPLVFALPYVRAEVGMGGVLRGRVALASVVASSAVAVALAALILRTTGLAMIASTLVLAVALAACYRRWLGGTTGDAQGTAIELTETLALLVAVALT